MPNLRNYEDVLALLQMVYGLKALIQIHILSVKADLDKVMW
jgi:hypothetical protein